MTVVDQSAIPFSVSIGGLDFSAITISCVLTWGQLQKKGFQPCTGELELAAFPIGFSEAINPRTNPSRFAPGTEVVITVNFESGNIQIPSKLRILQRPKTPCPTDESMTISIGDEFELFDYRTSEGDNSGVTVGTSTNPGTIIGNLLSAVGMGVLNTSVTEHPLSVPVRKNSSGSYVSQIGDLCFTRNRSAWQQADGTVNAPQIIVDATSLTPVAIYTVGTNEVDYCAADNSEYPPEKLLVVAISQTPKQNTDIGPIISTSRDPEDGNAIIERNTYRVTGVASSISIEIDTTRAQEKRLFNESNNNNLRLSAEKTKTRYYDGLFRLSRVENTVRKLRGVALPDFYPFGSANATNEFTFSTETTNYFYDSENVITLIRTEIREPRVLVRDPSTLSSSEYDNLTLAKLNTVTYTKVNGKYLELTKNINYRFGQEQVDTTPRILDNPPETQYQGAEYKLIDTQYSGTANFTPAGGSEFLPEASPIQCPDNCVVSDAQCTAIAQTQGALQHGRAFGVSFTVPLTPAWLQNFQPFRRVDFVEGAETLAFLHDGLTIAMDERSSIVDADGIFLGVVDSGIVTPPYQPNDAIAGGLVMGGILNDSVAVVGEDVVAGGVVIGGVVIEV